MSLNRSQHNVTPLLWPFASTLTAHPNYLIASRNETDRLPTSS
jgi:hypothetical protein